MEEETPPMEAAPEIAPMEAPEEVPEPEPEPEIPEEMPTVEQGLEEPFREPEGMEEKAPTYDEPPEEAGVASHFEQEAPEPKIEEPVTPDERFRPSLDSIYGRAEEPAPPPQPEPETTPAPMHEEEPPTPVHPTSTRDLTARAKIGEVPEESIRLAESRPAPAPKQVDTASTKVISTDRIKFLKKEEPIEEETALEPEPEKIERKPPSRTSPVRERRPILDRNRPGSSQSLEDRMSSVRSNLREELESIRKKKKRL
ncbi:MAG: hypothetical protein ACMUIE_10800 [Thermoplasmatota archaeon]